MSRSQRKSPVIGITTARTEKQDKREYNRALRHKVRQAIHLDEEVLPDLKEVSSPWNMAKDGKQRFNPRHQPKLLRK